jgi:hypothetical protein
MRGLVVGRCVGAAVAAAALIFTGAGPAARADDTSLGAVGGTARPIWSSDIRMDTETVQAICFGGFAEFRVDFRFVNEGAARRVRLGFPFRFGGNGEEQIDPPVGFQAWQGTRPLRVTVLRNGLRYGGGGYYVHQAVFTHGATMITVSYLTQPSGSAVGHSRADTGMASGMASWYDYWLHTGATWAGPIGTAVVRFSFADTFRGAGVGLTRAQVPRGVPVTSPAGWTTPLPHTVQWAFSSYEPSVARPSRWWYTQPGSDITLGFGALAGRTATTPKWTCSSAATGFDPRVDGSPGSGGMPWAEGVPGLGKGEWLQATFNRPVRLRELRIQPGNVGDPASFREFARPKTLTAVFSDGSTRVLHFADAPTLQRFPVDVQTRSVRLVIDSAYAGTDFPGTCISIVEFGCRRAPGFAPFARLIADPKATGHLTAEAGRAALPAPAPRPAPPWVIDDRETLDGGDLLGISPWARFPADKAPFRQPSTLAVLRARDSAVRLPEAGVAGEPVAVYALSSWSFEVRYPRGIDLLVNTRPVRVGRLALLRELLRETRAMPPYEDGRKVPFDLVSIGRHVVGLARPGRALGASCGDGDTLVPGQLFWRTRDATYHLYDHAGSVTIDHLVAVARSMLSPATAAQAVPMPLAATSHGRWWLRLAAGEILLVCMLAGLVFWMGRRAAL